MEYKGDILFLGQTAKEYGDQELEGRQIQNCTEAPNTYNKILVHLSSQ